MKRLKRLSIAIFLVVLTLSFGSASYAKSGKSEDKERNHEFKENKKHFKKEKHDSRHDFKRDRNDFWHEREDHRDRWHEDHDYYRDHYRNYYRNYYRDHYRDYYRDGYYRYGCEPGRNGIGYAYGRCRDRYEDWEDENRFQRTEDIINDYIDIMNKMR